MSDAARERRNAGRSPFDATPLNAAEYIDLLESRPELVLRVSDGTGDGTFRFWVDDGDFYWRCLNWGSGPTPCNETHLSAVLEDGTTQLLIERSHQGDGDHGEWQRH